MTAPARRTLERPGGRIAYLQQGDGPPLLLLHATLSSSRELAALARRLATRFAVTSVDRRASGESTLPPGVPAGPIDVAVHVEDLAALIEAEGLGPVIAVGHSYGGCLALELAARRPELVARAWVYEPPYAQAGPAAAREQLLEVGRRTARANEEVGPEAAAEVFLAAVAGAEAVAALPATARERIRGGGAAAVADAPLLGLDPAGLSTIGCPVAIAIGTRSSAVYGAIADGLSARVDGAVRQRVEGADHMAPVTQPGTIAALITRFTTG